ncbi:unnamed protein product [Prorocentrum cordatum]|uniref:Uncharacterized protein n=1 Tax=Prorocentrum cordatum TaxID=2364126 RepID=A0ABN9WG13_9DINO|nr:unnamed protein product [Polarella glacialis]
MAQDAQKEAEERLAEARKLAAKAQREQRGLLDAAFTERRGGRWRLSGYRGRVTSERSSSFSSSFGSSSG